MWPSGSTWTPHSLEKFQNAILLKDVENSFMRLLTYLLKKNDHKESICYNEVGALSYKYTGREIERAFFVCMQTPLRRTPILKPYTYSVWRKKLDIGKVLWVSNFGLEYENEKNTV